MCDAACLKKVENDHFQVKSKRDHSLWTDRLLERAISDLQSIIYQECGLLDVQAIPCIIQPTIFTQVFQTFFKLNVNYMVHFT